MNTQFVLEQVEEFNNRNFDRLFAEFYSPTLKVYTYPDFDELRGAIAMLNGEGSSAEKVERLEAMLEPYRENKFPDLEVLRGHVKKQFASPQELHIDVLEQGSVGSYVLTFERKRRDGIVVDAVDVYYVENGKIEKMWIAVKQN